MSATTLLDALGGSPVSVEDGPWTFSIGEHLHGAFGGANGGVLAAISVAVARRLATGRIPAGLDSRFLRGLAAGRATVVPSRLHEGRTLSCIDVDFFDDGEKLCTRSTVTLVDPRALEPFDDPGEAGAPEGWLRYEEGKPWPSAKGPARIPLIETFGPRRLSRDERGIATGIRVPWDEPGTVAEAACIAADISVGPPVAAATRGKRIPIPNPDLSLRFCADPDLPRVVVASARLERISKGLASTRIEVRAEAELVAVGISTTTLLAGASP